MASAGTKGVVASAHPLASEAGAAALRDGGTAFDAAVAVAATLNVVEPFMSGLAGQGYAIAWVAAEQRVRVLDFVPPIPRAFPSDQFSSREQLKRGPAAVGLPGCLAGWSALHDAYGRLPFDRLLQPAIRHAELGFDVGWFGAQEYAKHAPGLALSPIFGSAWESNFPAGAWRTGSALFRQPALAATLRRIAAEGIGVLYGGELGRQIAGHVQAHGGTITFDDLHDVQPVWQETACARYGGLVVHTPLPPCEGFQFLLSLRILDGLDLAALGAETVEHLDVVIRAIRLAAKVRIGHPSPDGDLLRQLLSDGFVENLRQRLRAGEGIAGPTEQWMAQAPAGGDPGHTTSFSLADAEGNLVCITQSLGNPFGSGVVVPDTGISLNNFLYWADVQPGSPNRATPGGRLPMCVSPSISLRNGVPELALGTPGSYGILQTQTQALVQYEAFGRTVQQAVDAPRGRLWDGTIVDLESRIAPATLAGLRRLGHDARSLGEPYSMTVGGMQAVRRAPASGMLTGAADQRRAGCVVVA